MIAMDLKAIWEMSDKKRCGEIGTRYNRLRTLYFLFQRFQPGVQETV